MTDNDRTPTEMRELPIGQLLAVLWRGRWTVIACTLLAAFIGVYVAEQQGTVWRASSRLNVEPNEPAILGPDSLLIAGGANNYTSTQAELLRSTSILSEALAELGGIPRVILEPGKNPLAWMKASLRVGAGKDNDIISVSLDSKHPEEASAVVNAVVAAYQRFHSRQKRNTAVEVLKHLSSEKKELHQEYAKKLDEITHFRKSNPGVRVDGSGLTVVSDKWRKLSDELAAAGDEVLRTETAWRTAKSLEATPQLLRQVLPSLSGRGYVDLWPAATAMVKQLEALEAERSKPQRLTAEHPEIKALDRAIAELRDRIAERDRKIARASVKGLEERWQSAQRRQAKLKESATAMEQRVLSLSAKDAELTILEAQAKQTMRMLDTLDKRIREININEVNDTSRIYVLDAAKAGTAVVVSNRLSTVAISVLLGVLAGLALAWMSSVVNPQIRSPGEITSLLHIPTLAILPRTDSAKGKPSQRTSERWDSEARFSEAIRSLRTAIYFRASEQEAVVLQVSSPDVSDGKTTIAGCLAIAMAKAGQRTLLVDADLRNPCQAKLFGATNESGLSTVLTGEGAFEEVVQSTDIEMLDILVSGPRLSSPAEAVNGVEFERLLEKLRHEYDRVVLDSPPILPVSDARIIATKCDAMLLVIRVDRSTLRRVTAAHDSLKGVGAKVLGAVLNDMPIGIGYGYGPDYGYYDGYGKDSDDGDEGEPGGEGGPDRGEQDRLPVGVSG